GKSVVFSWEVGSDSEIGWVKLRDPPAAVCAMEVAFLRPNRRSLIVPKAVRRRPDRGDCRPSPCNLLKTRQIQFLTFISNCNINIAICVLSVVETIIYMRLVRRYLRRYVQPLQ